MKIIGQQEKKPAKRGRPVTGHAKSTADRVKAHRQKFRQIECPPIADPKRRKKLERDPPKWMKHYMAASYPFPFSPGHKRLIDKILEAAHTGEGTATAQPRGEGKSSVCRGMGFYLQAIRAVRFPVLVGWKHMDAGAAFQMWLRMLCSSPEFAADYPEIATPFQYSTHATALKNLVWANSIPDLGIIEGERTGANVDTMHKVIQLPNSIGAIAARSAKGDAKGLNATLKDGTILRPDFLLIDDAQDVNMAGNPAHVAKTVDQIENVFFGMAGPQKRLSAAVACTVEAKNDVSEHWLTKRGWSHIRISRIESWPDGSKGGTWDSERDCSIRAMWDEWREIYLDEGQKSANKYFRKHRKAMTGKMQVSWKDRYERGKDVSAIDAAMHDWYKLGPDVFARGQQNQPLETKITLFSLHPNNIMTRTDNDRQPGDVPDWVRSIVAATDINPSYALSTVVVGFGADQRCAVLWYGIQKMEIAKEIPDAQKKQQIMLDLETHGKQLASLPCRPQRWIIDGGGSPQETVMTFAANSVRTCGLESLTAFGRAWRQYRPGPKDRKFEQAFIRAESRVKQWSIWNADYWREIAQKSWLGAIGAPGSCDLPKGNHRDFAEQICREQLAGKAETGGTWVYVWNTQPGAHDYGDCMAMAFAMAAMTGIGTGGQVDTAPRRKKYTQADFSRR